MKALKSIASVALIMTLVFLPGCTSGGSDYPRLEQPTMDERVGEQIMPNFTEPSNVSPSEGSSASGVLTVISIIESGDTEKALEDGQVTPTEVRYASLAIEEDTTDQWRLRAEQEQSR